VKGGGGGGRWRRGGDEISGDGTIVAGAGAFAVRCATKGAVAAAVLAVSLPGQCRVDLSLKGLLFFVLV